MAGACARRRAGRIGLPHRRREAAEREQRAQPRSDPGRRDRQRAARGWRSATAAGRHHPAQPASDVRIAALRDRRGAALRHGADGPHVAGARVGDLREVHGSPRRRAGAAEGPREGHRLGTNGHQRRFPSARDGGPPRSLIRAFRSTPRIPRRAGGRIRTDDLPLTRRLLWPAELLRRDAQCKRSRLAGSRPMKGGVAVPSVLETRRGSALEALVEAAAGILAADSLEGTLGRIAHHLRQLLHYTDLTVYEIDEAAAQLRPVFAVGQWVDEVLANPIPLGTGVTGWVVEHRCTRNVPNTAVETAANIVAGTPNDPEAFVCPAVGGRPRGGRAERLPGGRGRGVRRLRGRAH